MAKMAQESKDGIEDLCLVLENTMKIFQKDFIANSLLYPRDGRPLDASEVSVDAYVDVVTVNKASDLRIFK